MKILWGLIGLTLLLIAAVLGAAAFIEPVNCKALQNDIELQGAALAQCTQGACVINASDLIAVRRDFARYMKHCASE